MEKKQYRQPQTDIIDLGTEHSLLEASPDPVGLYDGEDNPPINDKTLVW